ncbi:MAG: exonuclease domain-containing protein [Eubacterium sp.]|nr:exonuclease domain-containing protein [Eubacterium sp.]
MNYIVFDLEWNQSPGGRAGEHPRMPFEIIEIGAVRLDDSFSLTGEFRRLVKPKLYTKLHKYIKDILSYDEEVLKEEGVSFKDACTDFLEWCGEGSNDGYFFCSWGPSDLHTLQNNMDFYNMEKMDFPLRFYDVQQIYAEKYSKTHSVCKLEKAIEHLKLNEDRPYHAAINDAYYTARVMQDGGLGDITEKYVYDTYRHPKRKSQNIHDFHDGIFEEILGEYGTKKEALSDKHVTDIRCAVCGKKTTNIIKTFQINNTTCMGVGKCYKHGRMLSTLKLRPASDSSDSVFVVKKVIPINKTRFKEIRVKKDVIAEKKREKDRKYKERKLESDD